MSRFEQEALGYGGVVIINSTTISKEDKYVAIKALEDSVINDLNFAGNAFAEDGTTAADTELNGKTIKAGDIWVLPIKSVKLTSGLVVLYKKIA